LINKVFQLLSQDWEFQKVGDDDWHNATVPGCVHQDLFTNDLIPDPFFRVNESKLQWIMDSDWCYRLFFTPSKEILNKKNKILSFSGIDTYADIYLNGEKIIVTNNMFHPWEKDVSNLLKSGKNELNVVFHSPTKEVLPFMKQRKYKLPADNDQAGDTSPYTRKAPYHYGWDWGPCFVTSGVWKDVILHAWDSWYVMHSSLLTETIEKDSATLSLDLEIFSDVNEEATILIDEPKSNTHIQIPVALVAGKNIF
jgi:Beta-galactosidase/beta-glucuronidase